MDLAFWAGLVGLLVWWIAWSRKRRFVAIVGEWSVDEMAEYLFLSGVGARRENGRVEDLAASEFQVTVAGIGQEVPIPEGSPDGTQAAVIFTADEGIVETVVTSSKYPDAEPLFFSFSLANPVENIVGNWTRGSIPD